MRTTRQQPLPPPARSKTSPTQPARSRLPPRRQGDQSNRRIAGGRLTTTLPISILKLFCQRIARQESIPRERDRTTASGHQEVLKSGNRGGRDQGVSAARQPAHPCFPSCFERPQS